MQIAGGGGGGANFYHHPGGLAGFGQAGKVALAVPPGHFALASGTMSMKLWGRASTAIVLALVAVAISCALWFTLTVPDLATLPPLKNGDLVFQTDRSTQMLAIFLATGSLYTHVGIIEIDPSGEPYVIEAAEKVRRIPLRDWIRRGYGERMLIERFRGLSPEVGAAIVRAASVYYGRPYDIFFNFGKDRIYCSELVFYAYQEGAQISLGHLQTMSQLNLKNFAARKIIQARWQRDPACQPPSVTSFDSCFTKIQQQPIITPASLKKDAIVIPINNGTW
jgi:hypothetical protein